jgi:hypothetical protein
MSLVPYLANVRHRSRLLVLLTLCGLLSTAANWEHQTAWGQQPPEVGYVYPPGGPAGSTVEVQLGGYDWTPDMQFFVLDERIKLEVMGPPGEMLHPAPPHWFGPKARNKPYSVPREVQARLTIPADMPPGVVGWQAANANGGTSVGQFVVGRGTYVAEEQLTGAERQLPALPLTLSGRLENKEEIDHYTLVASRTGPVTCTLTPCGSDRTMRPILQIRDPRQVLVVDAADTTGHGLNATFVAEAGQAYAIKLHDLDYRGNRAMIYQLHCVPAPRVVAALPRAGTWGEKRLLRFLGQGIAGGAAQWETVQREVEFPQDRALQRFPYRLKTPYGDAPEIQLELSETPQVVEAPDHDGPQPLQAPVAVTGTLEQPQERDEYTFQAVKGDSWSVAVDAQDIGSPLDVSLRILDSQGKQVAAADDGNGTSDAATLFNVPLDGVYRIIVRDLAGRGGQPDAVYRLRIERPETGFQLTLPDKLDVPLGGETSLLVKVTRQGDSSSAISLQWVGLPDGVAVPDVSEIAAGKNEGQVRFTADAQAAATAGRVTLRATAMSGTRQLSREYGILVSSIMAPRANVAPLYKDAGRTTHRGATYAAPVVVERLQGFAGEVVLQMAAHPDRIRQGIYGADLTVPAGVERIDFPLFLPEWVQTDRTSRIILNTVVRVPDPQGNIRYLVNKMDTRITLNVEGALLKLTAPVTDFELRAGQSIHVPLHLSRSPKLKGDVRLELLTTDDNTPLEAAAVMVPAGQEQARYSIRCLRPWGATELVATIRATVLPAADLPVISETRIVLLPSPSQDSDTEGE